MVNYKRVNKPTARRMFNMGYPIKLIPCKVSERVLYHYGHYLPIQISLSTCTTDSNKFDRSVREYEYYNCNAELGYYPHYYVSEEDYNKVYNYHKEVLSC